MQDFKAFDVSTVKLPSKKYMNLHLAILQHKRKTSHRAIFSFLFFSFLFSGLRLLSTMTQAEIKLCSLLLQEHFGEIVEKIGVHLIRTGSQPLRVIAHDTRTSLDQVCLDHINLLLFH